jgi:hypothetical protein
LNCFGALVAKRNSKQMRELIILISLLLSLVTPNSGEPQAGTPTPN